MRGRADRRSWRSFFRPERVIPPRSVRIRVQVNNEPAVDIDSKLALYQLDCNFGRPVILKADLPGELHVVVELTEGGT